ncbi:FecR domain-containing protein [Pigmentiphaga soli]|uniref:FecR domain-containing protein n=1 Tax=Pigmentiphaga soli TaxID=1007095 RepID=A0ABP8HF71_9BURK
MSAIADPVLQRAVEWKTRLLSGRASRADEDACLAWRRAADEHERAWQKVERSLADCLGDLKAVVRRDPRQAEAVRQALALPAPARREWLLGVAGLCGATGLALLAAQRQWPLEAAFASHATATGERRGVALADGSRLLLDARSAVDVDLQSSRRAITLTRGRMQLEAAAAQTPFLAKAPFCRLAVQAETPAGLMLARAPGRTVAVCTHGAVMLRAGHGARQRLQAGEGWWMGADGSGPLPPGRVRAAAAWERGLVEALDEPLGNVVEQLRAYDRGLIRISSRAAALRVQGVWSLDDAAATLDILARRLPLRVVRHGGWLTTIDLDRT